MKRFDQDYDLLLDSVDITTGELARAVLADDGIPSLLHGLGFEADATLGLSAIRHQLFVPRGLHDRARTSLEAAWGRDAVQRLVTPHGSLRAHSAQGDTA